MTVDNKSSYQKITKVDIILIAKH